MVIVSIQLLCRHYPSKEVEGDDYIDLGAATLDFYSSLVDLLAKCAPDKLNIQVAVVSLRFKQIRRKVGNGKF